LILCYLGRNIGSGTGKGMHGSV